MIEIISSSTELIRMILFTYHFSRDRITAQDIIISIKRQVAHGSKTVLSDLANSTIGRQRNVFYLHIVSAKASVLTAQSRHFVS